MTRIKNKNISREKAQEAQTKIRMLIFARFVPSSGSTFFPRKSAFIRG